MHKDSYATIFRSSAIIGTSQLIFVLSGLVRSKVAALILGPAGVGLAGLFYNLVQATANLSILGLNTSAVKNLSQALADDEHQRAATIRIAAILGLIVLSSIGCFAFFLFRSPIANLVLSRAPNDADMQLLSLGVFVIGAANIPTILFAASRKIHLIAWTNIAAAMAGTIVAIGFLFVQGLAGIVPFVLAAPFFQLVFGVIMMRRLSFQGQPEGVLRSFEALRGMILFGFAFATSGIVASGGHLVLRGLIVNRLGEDSLGYFQASWALGLTYLNFVLGAMAADYLPRLSQVIEDRALAQLYINQQMEVALLLGGPLLLLLLGGGWFIIPLLYSDAFQPAVNILRWHLTGDVLKLLCWPLGFAVVALGRGKAFVLLETIGILTLVGAAWLLIPFIGLEASGIAVILMNSVYLACVYAYVRHRLGFTFSLKNLKLAAFLLASAFFLIFSAAYISNWVSFSISIALSLVLLRSVLNEVQRSGLINPQSRICRIISAGVSMLGRLTKLR